MAERRDNRKLCEKLRSTSERLDIAEKSVSEKGLVINTATPIVESNAPEPEPAKRAVKERLGQTGESYADKAKAKKPAKSRADKLKTARAKAKTAAPPRDRYILNVEPGKASEKREEIWAKLKACKGNPRTQILKSRDSSRMIFVPDDGEATKALAQIVPNAEKRGARRPRLIIFDVPRSHDEDEISVGSTRTWGSHSRS